MPVAENKVRVSITLEKDLVKIMEAFCELSGASKSELVTLALDRLILMLDSKTKGALDNKLHKEDSKAQA